MFQIYAVLPVVGVARDWDFWIAQFDKGFSSRWIFDVQDLDVRLVVREDIHKFQWFDFLNQPRIFNSELLNLFWKTG